MIRRPLAQRFWDKVRKTPACWLWTASSKRTGKGYGDINVNGKMEGAHRVSWLLHRGAIPEGIQVLHSCDTPGCVRPDHLFLGTNQDNVDDKVAKGRQAALKGSDNPTSKLSETDVSSIRERYARGGVTMAALGREHGVTAQAIWFVIHKLTWKAA